MATAKISTTLEVSDEFKAYVDAKMNHLKKDNFVGFFTFGFAFRRFQRVWAHKYIKSKYNLQTRTIGFTGAKKIHVFKPNFRCLNYKVAFDSQLIEVLKQANDLLMFSKDLRFPHASNINEFRILLEKEALEFAGSVMADFQINPAVIEWRKQLPIWDHRVNLIEHIASNQVTIVSGGPGVGKSTQVPQYILEYMASCAQESKTIVIVPQRIVAITMAKRVAFERGESVGNTVGYRVATRYEHFPRTPLMFCTSEIMLRTMVNGDSFLQTVTHVVVDNIDVRDKFTDVVLLCLRECLITYPNLRLIIISGSVDNQLFVDYFNGAPVVNIPLPNDDTCNIIEYYLDDMYRITRRKPRQLDLIRLLPPCPLLKRFLECFYEAAKYDSIDLELICELILHICQHKPTGSILVYLPSYEDIKDLQQLIMSCGEFYQINYDLYILHRMVNTSNQTYVFKKSPHIRKIILGTALAESSYFIDDIYYVIDTGKVRETQFVAGTRLSNVSLSWISKAAAKRRSNRMGKTEDGPIERYQMYTKQEYERMAPLDTAEILKAPITDLCLLSRKIAPSTISLKEFFNLCIQPPAEVAVECSIKYLKQIEALAENESVTAWGNIMGQLPLEPRLTKMLMYALAFNCIEPIVTIVAFISLRGPFPLPALLEDQANLANSLREYSSDSHSDHLSLVKFFVAWQNAKICGHKKEFCKSHFIRGGIMDLVVLKRHQLLMHLHILQYLSEPPSARAEEHNKQGSNWSVIKACLTAGFAPQFACLDRENWRLRTKLRSNLEISKQSICYQGIEKLPTDWLIYEASAPHNFIKNITCVTPFTILIFGSNCSFEMKDCDDKFKPSKDMGLCRLNNWVQFSSQCSSLKEIIRITKKVEESIVFFITVPQFFLGSDAEKTFNIISNALKVQDITSEVNFIIDFGGKPIFTPIRINYSSQPVESPKCTCIDCPDHIYFAPVILEYKRYISPLLSENTESSSVCTEEADLEDAKPPSVFAVQDVKLPSESSVDDSK